MKRVFRRPSPAMVVAMVALIAALGGTAIAGGVLNKKKVNNIISNRAAGLSVLKAKSADSATNATNATSANTAGSARNVFAVSVASNGALLHATDPGITTQAHTGGSGVYGVLFPRNIDTCSFAASGKAGGREINSFQSGPLNRVGVLTFDSAGAASDFAFDIVMVC